VTFRDATVEIPGGGEVDALLGLPADPVAGFVMAHGAGAGMRHAFLEETAAMLGDAGMATFRYQFPYMQAGSRRPDAPALLEKTVRAAVMQAAAMLPGIKLVAGGKSMGGRMTSRAAATEPLPGVRGLVFLGFPLHAAGRPDSVRASHLESVALPMLFIQGTRDPLADLGLMRDVCARLGPRATLHVVEGGDHSFRVLKRSGRTQPEVMGEIRDAVAAWLSRLPA